MGAPIRSMTGFARVSKHYGRDEAVVTLKSLNHRGLDLHFHAPSEMDEMENHFRAAIKKAVIRGHLDVRITINRAETESALGINQAMLRAYVVAFRKVSTELGLPDSVPDLNSALRLPGMFSGLVETASLNGFESVLMEALTEALDSLNRFREREGGELVAFIHKHNQAIADACCQIEQIRSKAIPHFQQRLQERLRELLRSSSIEPQRLAQEAALLADRSDIGEEVARLKIHSNQLDGLLDKGGEVGKKLDFLLQEMNRETNTILSKTNGIGEMGLKITDLALLAKADIEKIREQALNLE